MPSCTTWNEIVLDSTDTYALVVDEATSCSTDTTTLEVQSLAEDLKVGFTEVTLDSTAAECYTLTVMNMDCPDPINAEVSGETDPLGALP